MKPRSRTDKDSRPRLPILHGCGAKATCCGGLFGRSREHFAAADTPGDDPIEKWGRRIGRTLSAIAFLALAVYLYVTYVL